MIRMQAWRYTTIALVWLGLTVPVMAADSSPEKTVQEAYRIEQQALAKPGSSAKAPWDEPHRDKLFSKKLAALLARDMIYQEEAGDMGNIDPDPFTGSQDAQVKELQLTVTSKPANGRAEVTASFRSFGKRTNIRFRMIEEDSDWKIDNIFVPVGGKDNIVDALNQPYDCGSFMQKPCQR